MLIGSGANTMVPAVLALREKGYTVRRVKAEDSREVWHAERQGLELIADDPLSLLGLAAMHETRGDNWKAEDEEIESFLKENAE